MDNRKKHPHDTYEWLPRGRSFRSTKFVCNEHQDVIILQDIKTNEYYCPACKKEPRQMIDGNGFIVEK